MRWVLLLMCAGAAVWVASTLPEHPGATPVITLPTTSGKPRIRHRRPRVGEPYRVAPGPDADYHRAVAEYADEVTRDLLDLPPHTRSVSIDASGGAPSIARQVVASLLDARAPPLLREGVARHVMTYFDESWTNRLLLEAQASRVARRGYVEPESLLRHEPWEREDPWDALLFIDMIAYGEDAALRSGLGALFDSGARDPDEEPAALLARHFDPDSLAQAWRDYRERFAKNPWPTPSYR